ncbi:MAG: substrate-binding domain-containing protein [Gemmobacter sp.]
MPVFRLPLAALAAAIAVGTVSGAAQAREQIRIVGSSTVFPYTQAVAEEFSDITGARPPIVEATGTGGGTRIFCDGIGERFPDITGASRAMTASEWAHCVANGVTSVSEAMIGHDGLTIAISRGNTFDWDLTLEEIYLALGAEVPVDGGWAANPYRRWSEIDPRLPDTPITVLGPPPTSGTRDAFVELALHTGCATLDHVRDGGFDRDWITANCSRMRTDGPFIEAGENDNLIVQRLGSDPDAMGIFGYSFLYENNDRLKGVRIGGVDANLATIGDGSYPIARPLYFYVKNAHRGVIPGLQEFVEEYMMEEALAPGGYLEERGLVTLDDAARARLRETLVRGLPMEAK